MSMAVCAAVRESQRLSGVAGHVTMRPCMRSVPTENIGDLVTRLERYGPPTAKMRCFLLLIQNGVNDLKHWIYVSDDDPAQPLVALLVTLSTPDLLVLDAFTEDDPASHEYLHSALLSPPVSPLLWQSERSVRADCWPHHLQPVLARAAGQRGYAVTPISPGAHLFVWEAGRNGAEMPDLSVPVGAAVLPLSACHLAKVKEHWPYLTEVPDAERILDRSVETELSAGVFLLSTDDSGDSGRGSPQEDSEADSRGPSPQDDSNDWEDSLNCSEPATESNLIDERVPAHSDNSAGPEGVSTDRRPPTPDHLVSWILLNTCGYLGFAHTLTPQRRRGFGRLALAELTRRCARRGLPAALATGLDNAGMLGAMRLLRFIAVQGVFWAAVTPPATRDGAVTEGEELDGSKCKPRDT